MTGPVIGVTASARVREVMGGSLFGRRRAARGGGKPRLFLTFADEIDRTLIRLVQESGPRPVVMILGAQVSQRLVDAIRLLPKKCRVLISEDTELADRVAQAWRTPTHPDWIVNAWWDGSDLVVLNAQLEEIRIRDALLRQIKSLRKAKLGSLEVSVGDIYFSGADVHLDWASLLDLIDESAALRTRQDSVEFNRAYGAAIRELRMETALRQSDIHGLDARHLRRIEKGEQRATMKALSTLAVAHGLELADYLAAVARRQGR